MTDELNLTTEMVRRGQRSELYEQWAKKKSNSSKIRDIKVALAEQGYCLDILATDTYEEVREAVVLKDIRYAQKCFEVTHRPYRTFMWDTIAQALHEHVKRITSDEKSVYEWFLQLDTRELAFDWKKQLELDALSLSYRAMTEEPTQLQKTMTAEQLYTSGAPYWVLNLTPREIRTVLWNEDQLGADDALYTLRDYLKGKTQWQLSQKN